MSLTGRVMASGRHAGEWLLVRRTFGTFSGLAQQRAVHDGAERPLFLCRRAYLIGTVLGGLFGNGHAGGAGVRLGRPLEDGDRLGWLVDLGAGTLQFFVNGAPVPQAVHTGVVGPLRAVIELHNTGDTVELLRGVSFAVPPSTRLLWPELSPRQGGGAQATIPAAAAAAAARVTGSKRERV